MISQSSLLEIREKLENSWSCETTYYVEDYYKNHHASYGQCAVTAILVGELMGGFLKRAWAVGPKLKTRHYWNEINGIDIDLTWSQFPLGTKLKNIEYVHAHQLLKNKWTKERFTKLKEKFLSL